MAAPRAPAVLMALALAAVAVAPAAHASDEPAPAGAVGRPAPGTTLRSSTAPPSSGPIATEESASSAASEGPAIVLPEPPPVVVSVPPAAEPPAAGAEGIDLALPDPPNAPVTITAVDLLPEAVAARLADPQTLHPSLGRSEREAMAAFYALGNYQPLWAGKGGWTAAAQPLIERLRRADEDALDPADYPVPALGVVQRGESADELAEAELKLSGAAIAYARDARGARIEPSRLSRLITPKLDLPAADAILTTLAGGDPGAALAAYNPQHAGYRALKEKLAELRASRPARVSAVRVPPGRALKVGMRDPRVPLIRARFGLGPPAEGEADAYDERVASAVASFQRRQGLPPNGVLTNRTIAALSGRSPARIEGDIIANMERWRWLPADLGERYVDVNVPEFRLRIFDGGTVRHEARVIVGKPETPTPIFSDTIEHVIVNPSWYVPPSILKKEFLPMMARDPLYAQRRGYQVVRRNGSISIRQPPGERNALGFIKFIFPNEHSVYLHDTPGRHLFRSERRAYSHGCVRVDQPFRLAELLLGRAWPEARMRALIGRGERTIKLEHQLPVHLTYFTVFVDERGELRTADDIYGFNRRVRAALGLDG